MSLSNTAQQLPTTPIPSWTSLIRAFYIILLYIISNGNPDHAFKAGMPSSPHPTFITGTSIKADLRSTQAASGLDNLKMADSPLKKINYDAVGKENIKQDTPVVEDIDLKKPCLDLVKEDVRKAVVAPTIKPEEAHEPLLQENPQRFVLFPIRYHEVGVSDASRV
jgi:hypothetical protein